MSERLDYVILGAGLRGLSAGLRLRQSHPDAAVRLVEIGPRPGGSVRTQRSNGNSCELGPFAFAASDIEPLLQCLAQPPGPIEAACITGAEFDGTGLREIAVEPRPVSFRSGCEEIVQACRRELGNQLMLGRAAKQLQPVGDGFEIDLGGEAATTLRAENLILALPLATAASLLAGYDPVLPETAERLVREQRAFVFLGGQARDCAALTGYGVVPAEALAGRVAETIYCTNVFPGHGLRDRFLLRSELVEIGADDDDDRILEIALTELRRWTDCAAEFGFRKVHRFDSVARDATWAECRTRLLGLEARVPNLQLA